MPPKPAKEPALALRVALLKNTDVILKKNCFNHLL